MLYPIFSFVASVYPDGIKDATSDAHQYHQQGYIDGDDNIEIFHQHLDAYENEHDGDALLQMTELVNRPAQKEEEAPESQHGKDVRSIDDDLLLRDPEDGRDAVHGKDDIGGGQQHY